MKQYKISNCICISLIAIFLLSFLGCATTEKTTATIHEEYVSASQKYNTIFLYDNCPNEKNARIVFMALKSKDKGYDGVTPIAYSGSPDAGDVQAIKNYVSTCQKIKEALKVSKGLCKLTFNTEKTGTGKELNLSSEDKIQESIRILEGEGKNSIYAIYNY